MNTRQLFIEIRKHIYTPSNLPIKMDKLYFTHLEMAGIVQKLDLVGSLPIKVVMETWPVAEIFSTLIPRWEYQNTVHSQPIVNNLFEILDQLEKVTEQNLPAEVVEKKDNIMIDFLSGVDTKTQNRIKHLTILEEKDDTVLFGIRFKR